MADNITAQTSNQLDSLFTYSFSFSLSLHVFVSVIAVLITIFIVLANGIIIVALVTSSCRDQRRGRNVITRILMASMAVTDASMALAILPLAIQEIINNDLPCRQFDWCFAKFYLTSVLGTVSIYHVVGMALDRYMTVCRPLMYRQMTNRSGYVMISLAWIVPCLVVSTWGLILWHGVIKEDKSTLSGPGSTKLVITSFIWVLFFYVPFLIIFILYFLILQEVARFHKRRPQLQAWSTPRSVKNLHVPSNILVLSDISTADRAQDGETDNRQTQDICHWSSNSSIHVMSMATTYRDRIRQGMISSVIQKQSDGNQSNRSTHIRGLDLHSKTSPAESQCQSCEQARVADTKQTALNASRNPARPLKKNKRLSLKAVRTVGSIVMCFTLCWLPYVIYLPVNEQVTMYDDPVVYFSLSWLTYLNSALNPLVYCSHRSIRKAVKDLICCRSLMCRS